MTALDFKYALRSITRNKVQSSISILGLGIGLGCIILLLALILHEKSFNRFIPDHRNVYRIVLGESGVTSYPLAETMKEEFPEVKDFSAITRPTTCCCAPRRMNLFATIISDLQILPFSE